MCATSWGSDGSRCPVGQWRAGGGSVMLWAMFCWETLGPAIHMLLTYWCQRPQDAFRVLVESMPRRVGAVLAAHGGPTAY